MKSQLPDKLSDLIALAIRDARGLDINTYSANARNWHRAEIRTPLIPGNDPLARCEVCFAGSVIAGSLKQPPTRTMTPRSRRFSSQTRRKLEALEMIRNGQWFSAFQHIAPSPSSTPPDIIQDLINLPMPLSSTFGGWGEFDRFLGSVEAALPELRKIECRFENLLEASPA